MKKIVGPLLLVILVIGVIGAIVFVVGQQIGGIRAVEVRGLVGSEKLPYFNNEEVIEALKKGGFEVNVEKAGSREIATSYDLSQYDFAFPSGVPAAKKISDEQDTKSSYDVFFTPMAIASWKPIAQVLEANGIATDQGEYYTLDMAKMLELVEADTRWQDLESNDAYAVNKSVLVSSTDVRKSNSAAMYLSLASYVANGNNVVQSDANMRAVMPLMEELFLKQGFQAGSSKAPFDDYLTMGMGKAPLVMIYEAQFVYAAAEGGITSDMVLMYPAPTIYSKHILVPTSEDGKGLGELLQNDTALQQLAVEHGFRTKDVQAFRDFAQKHQIAVPDNLVNVIDPPSYEMLEGMIQLIEQKYE